MFGCSATWELSTGWAQVWRAGERQCRNGYGHRSIQSTDSTVLFSPARSCAQTTIRPAKTTGVHPSFPFFVRLAYVWLLVAADLSVRASWSDVSGGIWGASRHALTVGFLSTMVFAIGQRILPAFCGARVLYSPRLMLASLAALNVGCVLRFASEIPAYENNVWIAWHVLPCSGVIELLAVGLFAVNLALTLLQPPAHLRPAVAIS